MTNKAADDTEDFEMLLRINPLIVGIVRYEHWLLSLVGELLNGKTAIYDRNNDLP